MSLETSESDRGKSKSLCSQNHCLIGVSLWNEISGFEVNHHDKKTKKYSRQFSPKVLLLPVKMSLRTSESDNGKSKSLCYVILFRKNAKKVFRWDPFKESTHRPADGYQWRLEVSKHSKGWNSAPLMVRECFGMIRIQAGISHEICQIPCTPCGILA